MTYNELKTILNEMSREELSQDAVAYVVCDDEYVQVSSVLVAEENDVLEKGHVYFSI